ncbi:NAD-dependent epimerase/dehydratase family protein [Streptomyces triticirhizae]|uniref:NAD-dependent epimerase/dehydratase family protein n=1 Tax=Streptomyces triticirhizae TaxID=2483353 RepID=UPI001F43F328|nr:NAD(P)-dependent oxidoreductase [Streptomyces triticirhizae]
MSEEPVGGARRGERPVRAVVLGGSGFLGRQVCAGLAARGAAVLSVARRDAPGFPSVRLDVPAEGPDALAEVLAGHRATVVVNAAGAVWDYDGEALQRANVALVERLRDAVVKAPGRPRVVQLGTVFEYALPDDGRRLTESAPLEPTTAYGASKLRGAELLLAADRDGLLDAVVLRATTCLGPGLPASSLLGRVAAELRAAEARGESATVRLSPLTARRDVVDSRDLAAAVAAAATAPVTGRAVNIGSGHAVGVRRLVELLVSVSGVPATVVEESPATGRSAGVDWLAVHTGLAERLLGWRPGHDVAATVRAVWGGTTTNVEEGPD